MSYGKARLVSKQNTREIWFIASLTLIFVSGCGDPDHSRIPGLTLPTVISIAPPKDALGACPNSVVTATFSEAMNVASVNSSTFTVTPGVTGTITHDASNTVFTFTPSSPLAIGAVYTATITTGVRDLFGNTLASNFVWSFTTAANGCNPPPTVLSVSPPNGSVGMCSNSVVSATFSEAMNVASINSSTFTVAPGVTGTISHDASNTIFTFTPSSPLAITTVYTATITTGVRDLFGNALASNFVWSFTTAANGCNPAPVVVSVTPPNAASGICSSSVVTATFSEAMNVASVNSSTFTVTPGVTGTITHDASNTVFTFTPSSPLAIGTVYTATITTGVRDLFGNALASNFVWSFTTAANGCNPPPIVLSVSPPNGSVGVCSNSVVSATFSEAMNVASINAATFTVAPGVSGTVTHDPSNTVFTLTPSSPLAISTVYTATITTGVRDLFGNALASNFVWGFTTAANGCNPAPTVLSVTPPNASTGVCSNSVVSATFSEAMNVASVNSSAFTVAPGVSGAITHDASDTVFTFTPSSPLAISTVYTATITTGVRDLFGNTLASNFIWSFTTAANGCNPPPIVLSVSPPNGSVGLCPNTIVTAIFSEAMDPSSIDGTTFTLTGPGSSPVAGQVTYDPFSNTAIFTPSSGLPLSTVFIATITTATHDMFGNALASDFVWSFTTGANPCQPASPPISVTPPNGSAGVCPNIVIAATFPQAMDPATINATTFVVTPGVTGTITPDASNTIFTFTPSGNLTLRTLYTVTITTGAKDQFGNALASNFVWTFTTGATSCPPPPPPLVISVSPAAGAAGVCPNTVISATFSEAMDPATINDTTFTVAPGVTGTVTLDGTGQIATFTPSGNLALNTTYTATITTGVQDLFGNALATDFVWSFTTATLACQAPVPMGSAANFEVLGASTVTNTGLTIISGGDLGLSPGSSVTGFPPGTLTAPAVMHLTDPVAAQAQLDLSIAYNHIAGLTGAALLPGDMSGLTLTPGLYKTSSTVMLSGGNVTLDAQGNANAIFIFQIGSTLTTITGTQVVLAGGAQSKNIFWQVGSSATLGTNSIFKGNILALTSITITTGVNLEGRALAQNGAVTLDSNTITAP
jgi:Ice-binding-like/Bacterial Ig-like domain